jgi:signal transduction histidine kinase
VVEDIGSASSNGTIAWDDGYGLIGMRERATALGGTFDAGPVPDGGFRVQVRLPTEGHR